MCLNLGLDLKLITCINITCSHSLYPGQNDCNEKCIISSISRDNAQQVHKLAGGIQKRTNLVCFLLALDFRRWHMPKESLWAKFAKYFKITYAFALLNMQRKDLDGERCVPHTHILLSNRWQTNLNPNYHPISQLYRLAEFTGLLYAFLSWTQMFAGSLKCLLIKIQENQLEIFNFNQIFPGLYIWQLCPTVLSRKIWGDPLRSLSFFDSDRK